MKDIIEQDTTQWRLACEALLRERYAMTGLDLEGYRRLEAQVAKLFDAQPARSLPASRP